MRGWWWPLGLLLLASAAEGLLFQLNDAGVLDVLERWRQRPRAVVITAIEIALLLTAAGLFTTTSGWAATGWYVAGLIIAGMLVWTTHLILKAPAPRTPATEPAPAKPVATPPRKRQAYAWARSPGQQWPMHAVPMADGVPEPRAYCGSEYDPGDVAGSPVVWSTEGDLRPLTCKTCRTRIQGVSFIKA